MQLFYQPDIEESSSEIIFDKEESRHINKVLRKREGDLLQITNGNGYFFKAEIILSENKKCTAKILEVTREKSMPYRLHLAVAPTKLNDRYEWFLEKATEIGISEITPIICDHSERKVIKPERYEKIIQSAMKQSLKANLPTLNAAIPYKQFIKEQAKTTDSKYIAHCEEGNKASLKESAAKGENLLILIGPEGDFSREEIQFAIEHNFKPVSLGNSRLRTETAAIVAAHSIAFVNED